MLILIIVGIGVLLFGALVIVKFPNRPGGELNLLGMKISSPGAGLILILAGMFVVYIGATATPSSPSPAVVTPLPMVTSVPTATPVPAVPPALAATTPSAPPTLSPVVAAAAPTVTAQPSPTAGTNQSPASGAIPIKLDQMVSGSLDVTGGQVRYNFAANANDVALLEISGQKDLVPGARIFAADGSKVCENFAFSGQPTRCTFPQSGTYLLVVGKSEVAFNSAETGKYTLNLLTVPH